MEAIVLSKEAFEEIKQEIKEINQQLQKITSPLEHFLDNKEFVKLMRISSKTAQIWRDKGKIGFVQEGKKIYYRMSDIENFFEQHHRKPFRLSKRPI